MKKIICILLILILGGLSFAYAAQPLESLKGPIDQVVHILADPKYNDPSQKDIQQEDLWKVIKNVFDFNLVSKLVLGSNNKNFSAEQFKTFTDIFSELLGSTYVSKLREGYKGESVKYLGEDMLTDVKAQVRTIIIRNGTEVPVDYSMRLSNGEWKIYDVKIEGISLVKNYRTQFDSFLIKNTPDQLIEHLKKKGVEIPQT